jgi:hypothetical protein
VHGEPPAQQALGERFSALGFRVSAPERGSTASF